MCACVCVCVCVSHQADAAVRARIREDDFPQDAEEPAARRAGCAAARQLTARLQVHRRSAVLCGGWQEHE